jgi:penicillin-binding protein 2
MSLSEPISSLTDLFDDEPEEDPYRRRLTIIRFVVVVALLAVVAQLYRLQIVEGSAYRDRADNNRFRLMSIDAPRGVIYDRNREIIARNRPTYTIAIIQADLPPQPEIVYRRLGTLLSMDPKVIADRVSNQQGDRFGLVRLKANAPQDLSFIIEERHRELPGVHVVIEPSRDYVDGPLTSHVIGYTGPVSSEQYAQLKLDKDNPYRVSDRIGQTGLELAYERDLRGRAGERQMEVDAAGREVRTLGVTQPAAGNNLITTLDMRLQRAAYEVLSARLEQYEVASFVALDPSSGQVLALVHLPAYDNNLFSRGITDKELQALLGDARSPLLNGAIASAYSPGSTLEAVTGTAALQEGVITADQKTQCNGQIIVPSRNDPSVGTRFIDTASHGDQDIVSAIADQCRIFFYLVGGGDPDGRSDGVGVERLARYARAFGLAEASGIDLDGEVSGALTSPEQRKARDGLNWYKGDTYLAAIGENYVLATPLQMASVASVIANGGTLYRPQVLAGIEDDNGTRLRTVSSEVRSRLPVNPGHIAVVRSGMRAIFGQGDTEYGTKYSGVARATGAQVGKLSGITASVEYARPDPRADALTHGWFIGFAPSENPKVAMAVFLGRGKGPEDAAAAAREITARYLDAR